MNTATETTAAPATETVTIERVVYTVTEKMMPGSARRSHGGPVLQLVAADGSVAGSLTWRASRRGFSAVRSGVAKGLSDFTARKLLGA